MIAGAKIVGMKKFLTQMAAISKLIRLEVQKELLKSAVRIQNNVGDIVPVEWGNLKASGFIYTKGFDNKKPIKVKENNTYPEVKAEVDKELLKGNPTVGIGYNANYAIYVHENLNATHKEGKSAKFLEKAYKQEIPNLKRNLQRI